MTKRSPLKIIRDKAWNTFSLWIRRRDKFTCYTCNNNTRQMQAGHFWHGVLDFDEENIHCQCSKCNNYLHGNLSVYSARLLSEMGVDGFKALEQRHYMAMKGEKRDIQDYQNIIDKYKI
jgi:hypothetical protein